jgi:hypothetical protein
MGDVGDYWREAKEHHELAKRLKEPCQCGAPLWPGQRCPICGQKDPRKKNRKRKNK